MANHSETFNVILVGFPGLQEKFHILVSVLLFVVYVASLAANGTVVCLIIVKEHLHHPMYLTIANLAASDLLFDTLTLPKIIARYWFGSVSMSFSECLFQMFSVHHLGSMDSFIMMLMAIDRYVAICKPLQYPSIITNKLTGMSCIIGWVILTTPSMVPVILNSQISYCGRNKINGCFCTNIAITLLSCKDITPTKQLAFGLAMVVLLVPLFIIIMSYVIIIKTIRANHSENWQKAFYTCATHLIVIVLYYTPRVFIYTANQVQLILDPDLNVVILCLYTFIPHIANPVIYCLRNKDIKRILGKRLTRHIHVDIKDLSVITKS
ncbi:olfactory receptor 2AT4-like [Spea bombifrons]|uniref:olfactory receptor 2AT4-like n=1 Tax=Spea bombifrons TaxID=233779 RepID=UPI002349C206|nr:olfactory receptor 2AT4-like [Spea bombifrons]